MRFVSFLDILGFTELVDSGQLAEVQAKLESALSIVPYGLSLGNFRAADAKAWPQRLRFSAFSDTYIIWSYDDSITSFFEIIAATKLVSASLFAAGLGVRGAISCGEAECISHSSQLVGRAVTRASSLEKQQEWFGIIVDPAALIPERRAILELPFVKPLVVEYDVPLKADTDICNPCAVINWRFNMSVEKGVASLFRESDDISGKRKRANTLSFCRWLRENNLSDGAVYDHDGKRLRISWLTGVHVGSHAPGTEGAIHGDEF